MNANKNYLKVKKKSQNNFISMISRTRWDLHLFARTLVEYFHCYQPTSKAAWARRWLAMHWLIAQYFYLHALSPAARPPPSSLPVESMASRSQSILKFFSKVKEPAETASVDDVVDDEMPSTSDAKRLCRQHRRTSGFKDAWEDKYKWIENREGVGK